ncbi:Hydrogenase-2 large chain precursor [Serratia fonticola]|uniref:hydrogenase (acceptor) n=1 Tax=Serratia fonticola TaxID=47917 RepID=A0A4U9UHD2_SERFO|nr:Hydrogenase-2 large chain precursor [Serratia fonticola]
MSQRITIDPVTRIEGHLRIDCEIEDGKVVKAWSSGTMWRGMEEILQGNDPRDAWMIVQRICGVCTTIHALALGADGGKCAGHGDPGQCPVYPQYHCRRPQHSRPYCAFLPALGAGPGWTSLGAEGRPAEGCRFAQWPV